jgi:hypothetical protein
VRHAGYLLRRGLGSDRVTMRQGHQRQEPTVGGYDEAVGRKFNDSRDAIQRIGECQLRTFALVRIGQALLEGVGKSMGVACPEPAALRGRSIGWRLGSSTAGAIRGITYRAASPLS